MFSSILGKLFPDNPNPTVEKLQYFKTYITENKIDEWLIQKVDFIAGGVFGALVLALGFWTCTFGVALVVVGFGTVHYFSVEIPPALTQTVDKIGEILVEFRGIRTTLFLLGIILMQAAPNPTAFTASFIATIAIYKRNAQLPK